MDGAKGLPLHAARRPKQKGGKRLLRVFTALATLSLFSVVLQSYTGRFFSRKVTQPAPAHVAQTLAKCRGLHLTPAPPKDFHSREQSDRYEGGKPVLIKNATIWTGNLDGIEILESGSIYLDKGIIKDVGDIDILSVSDDTEIIDAQGKWVTPGIVDLHSHIGVYSSPSLKGSSDGNSHKGLVLPWLRSLDGLNTHDESYALSISGGVTSVAILPGSANAIGGQAFAIKLRRTAEKSATSKVIEPPFHIVNGTDVDPEIPPRWRLMKQACGENPSRSYSGTRMDTIWAYREGYNEAKIIKNKQDAFCAAALDGQWAHIRREGLGAGAAKDEFPESLKWEMLVDVLRGRVKIQNHCYEAVDLDGIVRLTNEFEFPIAAFHHAHETYLVPDLLKKAWGSPPTVALFSTSGRYKREAFRGSEFAPKVLSENGLNVVLKSDHPVLNSRYLLFEASQAHYYGLPTNLAIAAVTTTPAKAMGLDHRIGSLKKGYDADVVIWDTHPLSLSATPIQVFIDGLPQLAPVYVSPPKPDTLQKAPKTPNWDKEAKETVEYDGLPPLSPSEEGGITATVSDVIFLNISAIYVKSSVGVLKVLDVSPSGSSGSVHTFDEVPAEERGIAVVRSGKLVCAGTRKGCGSVADSLEKAGARIVDLKGGSLTPGLTAFGSSLGLSEITAEASTSDGYVADGLVNKAASVAGGDGAVFKAVDGLLFETRNALVAYRGGVTSAISSPIAGGSGFLAGISTLFSTSAAHKLAPGAVLQSEVALHLSIGMGGSGLSGSSSGVSVSTQIAALRHLLGSGGTGDVAKVFKGVVEGKIPLVVAVSSADIIASLIQLKSDVESANSTKLKLILHGAEEAHLLARELGEAGVGVIISPTRPFPGSWQQRRILPGPPLSKTNAIAELLENNVTVAIGHDNPSLARDARFNLAWSHLEAGSEALPRSEALALASTNLDSLLGLTSVDEDVVLTSGGSIFDYEGKVVGVISAARGRVELF